MVVVVKKNIMEYIVNCDFLNEVKLSSWKPYLLSFQAVLLQMRAGDMLNFSGLWYNVKTPPTCRKPARMDITCVRNMLVGKHILADLFQDKTFYIFSNLNSFLMPLKSTEYF